MIVHACQNPIYIESNEAFCALIFLRCLFVLRVFCYSVTMKKNAFKNGIFCTVQLKLKQKTETFFEFDAMNRTKWIGRKFLAEWFDRLRLVSINRQLFPIQSCKRFYIEYVESWTFFSGRNFQLKERIRIMAA